MRKFIWLLLFLIVGWGLVWYLCLNRNQVLPLIQQTPPQVQAVIVDTENVTITNEYIGHIEAIHSVSVFPYIAGFIDKVLIRGGSEVQAGDTLFVLKQDQYLAEVEAAEAKVVGATADLEKARLYLSRLEQTASEAISKTEKDDAQTAFLVAEANLAAAKASLKAAKVNYNYTIISATINGVVGNINATKGEYVSPEGKALAYVLQYDPIRVRFSMPEKDFLNLGANVNFFKTGELKLRLSNGQIITTKGSVRFADNQVQSGTSSIDLFADFDNPNHLLLPGAYVTVLYDEQLTDVILIERKFVTMQPDGYFVYVVNNDLIEKRPVKLGATVGTKVVVVEGLEAGDLLIVSPVSADEVGQQADMIAESMDDAA